MVTQDFILYEVHKTWIFIDQKLVLLPLLPWKWEEKYWFTFSQISLVEGKTGMESGEHASFLGAVVSGICVPTFCTRWSVVRMAGCYQTMLSVTSPVTFESYKILEINFKKEENNFII